MNRIISTYASIARPIMLNWMVPSSCIAATRLTIEVLQYFGLTVIPYATRFVVQAEAIQFAYISGIRGEEQEQMRAKSRNWTDIPVQVGWEGHVVCIAEGDCLIDSSFDQISTPDKGLVIPPTILALDLGRAIELKSHEVELGLVNDEGLKLKVIYQPLDDDSYQDSEAWNDAGLPLLALEIIKKMRKIASFPFPR